MAAIPSQPRRDRWNLPPARPAAEDLPPGRLCACTIPISHGLPCCHVLFNYLQQAEPLPLRLINSYWRWQRNKAFQYGPVTLGPYDPQIIQSKGRPKNAVATEKSIATTKRLPSAFEIAKAEKLRDAEAPPLTAPAVITRGSGKGAARGRGKRAASPIVAGPTDLYEAGTEGSRASARYLANLADVKEVTILENDEISLIPTDFEGNLDVQATQHENADREAQQEIQGLIWIWE
ncbi:hypothetical protein MAPG_09923 [Magnaporthiopsis poae ATCC 64411]|uniref:SWIM-type domain-containing protein n=1 Tax=Magnaporthiopsis poae (strain ATCC 64411 / 73-15) TaxID=644358 RepID=A0A0C4EB76_MAGP6|nr:hypothetical protein MAPG_09923 [Magnaporthiopsis poae ATCC 64411]